jgi:hypothetical protein
MCDSLVASAAETAAGITLFAKNSDRKSSECQTFLQFPEASHPPRSTVRATHIEIPQVAETYRVMGHSPWWVWGFEHGVNEHGVAIGNQTVFSNEPIEPAPGLIGMDLVRLALERGRDAREALEVIATLIESYGQGGPAFAPDAPGYHNSFLLADPKENWLLETSNRRWVARRTQLASLSNHFCLAADWEIGSRDLEAFARAEGWWRGAGRLDVAAAYRDRGIPARISEGRLRRTRELLAASRGRHDVASMQRILRDHLEGGSAWQPGASIEEENYFTVCAHSEPLHWTTASLVAPLPATAAGRGPSGSPSAPPARGSSCRSIWTGRCPSRSRTAASIPTRARRGGPSSGSRTPLRWIPSDSPRCCARDGRGSRTRSRRSARASSGARGNPRAWASATAPPSW